MKLLFFTLTIIFLLTSCDSKTNKKRVYKVENSKSDKDYFHANSEYSAKITTSAKLLNPPKKRKGRTKPTKEIKITEILNLKKDNQGNFRGYRNLSSDDGFEFVFIKNKFCSRFRYEKFICREALAKENAQRIDDLTKSYIYSTDLIKEQFLWEKTGKCKSSELVGCIRYKIKRDSSKGDILTSGVLKDLKILGNMERVNDELPLFVNYSWSAILVREDGKRISINIKFHHEVKLFNKTISMPPKNQIMVNGEKKRPLRDLKALLGTSIPKNLKYLYGN